MMFRNRKNKTTFLKFSCKSYCDNKTATIDFKSTNRKLSKLSEEIYVIQGRHFHRD
jgi:hypothetical protein